MAYTLVAASTCALMFGITRTTRAPGRRSSRYAVVLPAATLMTVFIVPVLYDILRRDRKPEPAPAPEAPAAPQGLALAGEEGM